MDKHLSASLQSLATWILFALCVAVFAVPSLYLGGADSLKPLYFAMHLFAPVTLGALFWSLKAQRKSWAPDGIDLTVIGFALYAFVLLYATGNVYAGRQEMMWIADYAVLFLAVRHGLSSRHMRWLAAASILLLVVNAVYGLYYYADPGYTLYGTKRAYAATRIAGLWVNPNSYGDFAAVGTLLTLYVGARVWGQNRSLGAVVAAVAGVIGASIAFTVSRGAITSFCLGVAVLLITSWKNRNLRSLLPVLGLAVIIAGAAAAATIEHSRPFLEAKVSTSDFSRIGADMYKDNFREKRNSEAIVIWKKAPLFGHGPSAYNAQQLKIHDAQDSFTMIHTHNDYLNTLVDYGAAGMMIIVGFVGAILVSAWRSSDRLTLLLPVGAVIGFHSFVDFSMHIPSCAMLVIAIAAYSSRREQAKEGSSPVACIWASRASLAGLVLWSGYTATLYYSLRVILIACAAIPKPSVDECVSYGDRLAAIDSGFPQLMGIGKRLQEIALDPSSSATVKATAIAKALEYHAGIYGADPLNMPNAIEFLFCLDATGQKEHANTLMGVLQDEFPQHRNILYAKARHQYMNGDKTALTTYQQFLSLPPTTLDKRDAAYRKTARSVLANAGINVPLAATE